MLCVSLATEYPSAPYTPCQLPSVAVSRFTKFATAPAIRLTVAVPDAVPSALVAFTVTCAGVMVPGAVYSPLAETLPGAALAGLTPPIVHVTAWLEAPVTVALYCCCCPAPRLTVGGLTLTFSAPGPLPPKNTPLTTAFVPVFRVTLIFTCPDTFHTRYTPLLKLERLLVSSTLLVFASTTCTVSTLPLLSQSTAYSAN